MSKRIKFDPNNFNRHTSEGMELLEKSVKEVGVIESITIDKAGEIVTGNARKETFDKLGFKPKFIELKEGEYPVIQTDLQGERRVKAAILANTVALRNIDLDTLAIEEMGIDLEEVGIHSFNWDENDLDKFFTKDDSEPREEQHLIVLHYTLEDYEKVIEAFSLRNGSKEQIIFELLELK